MSRRHLWIAGCAALAVQACQHDAPVENKPAAATAQATPPATMRHASYEQLQSLPVEPLRTRISAAELTSQCEQAEKDCDALLAKMVAVPDGQRTFDNSFNAFEQSTSSYADTTTRLSFLKDIHPDEDVRRAASACEERAGKYIVKIGARKDIYLALKNYLAHPPATDNLDAQDRRLIELTMRDFRRNGLELSDANRQKLVDIRSRLAELSTKYSSNLDENQDSIEATQAELTGLPDSLVKRLKKSADGKYIITTKYPDYYPVMENAKSETLRKRMELAFDSREAKRNLPLLAEAIALRDHAAKLLGYPTHADFVAEDRMAKNAKTIADFLSRLRDELKPGRDALDNQMRALKAKETHQARPTLNTWDWRYYLKEIKERDYSINDEQVRSYFPADKVLAGMFQVYSQLLHVSFVEVPKAATWAPGVTLYEMREAPNGRLLAEFYVDLFPRPGKYGHAASFSIGLAREWKGGYQIPLSALVVNFNPPANGKSARLSMQEVETLFHEFGHIVHQDLTTARYASLAGTNVATDFVEAPSQMLENWVYRPEVLKLISEDPNDPSKSMPEELAKRLAQARTYDAGVRYTRQVFLATFDQYLHTHGDAVDPDAVEHQVKKEIMGYPVDPSEHMAASFGHLMGGYDAGYYGYLWSQVFAEDMFTRFEKEGVLNPQTGRAYRDIILAKGRTEEPSALLEEFLGRAPNEHAFLRLMNIEKASPQG